MSKEKEEVNKEPSKFDKLKEMWKDKRGRAKIKLCLYLIFFVGVVIFARVLGYQNSKLPHNDNVNNNSFIYTLKDNYEYDINIEKDNNKYNYHGRKLGLNESIKVKDDNKEEYYYRSVFEELFPSRSAALTVPSVPSVACSTAEALAWDEAFRNLNDPSGRAVKGVHADSY